MEGLHVTQKMMSCKASEGMKIITEAKNKSRAGGFHNRFSRSVRNQSQASIIVIYGQMSHSLILENGQFMDPWAGD